MLGVLYCSYETNMILKLNMYIYVLKNLVKKIFKAIFRTEQNRTEYVGYFLPKNIKTG